MDNKKLLFYSHQTIDQDDVNEVVKAINGDLITTGPYVEKFEKQITEFTGSKYAVVCSSGTAALLMAYNAFELKKKSRVLLPSMTFVGTANAAALLGLSVDFVDCCESSGLISIIDLEKKLKQKKYDLVIPVHLNGRAAQIEKIYKLSKKYNFLVIDDASHALGTKYIDSKNKKTMIGSCTYSQMTTFSFHPVKNITMGEGGVVTTNNKILYENLKKFRNHGIEKNLRNFTNKDLAISMDGKLNPWYYEVHNPGFNLRASDINCALGSNQIKKLNKFKKSRKVLIKKYEELLYNNDQIEIVSSSKIKEVSWHLFVLKINFNSLEIDRSKLMELLLEKKIRTQVHYIPIHLMPFYKKKNLSLDGTISYYKSILSFPLFPKMNEDDVEYVSGNLVKILSKYRK